jgi:hypothetical protein
VTPWEPAKQYITDSLSGLQNASGQSQAAVNAAMPGLQGAFDKVSSLITDKPQYLQDATAQIQHTINGDNLGKNPYSSQLAGQIADETGNQYNTTFGASGRAGGGLAAMLSSQGVGTALANFYNNQYNTDRSLQQQATLAAPAFYQNEFSGVSPLTSLAGTSALLPLQGANAYSAGVTSATAPYASSNATNTQTTSGLGTILGPALGLAGALFTGGGSALSGLTSAGSSLGSSLAGLTNLNTIGSVGSGLGGLLAR